MSKVVYDYLEDLEYDFKNIMNLSKVMQDKSDAYQREMRMYQERIDKSKQRIQEINDRPVVAELRDVFVETAKEWKVSTNDLVVNYAAEWDKVYPYTTMNRYEAIKNSNAFNAEKLQAQETILFNFDIEQHSNGAVVRRKRIPVHMPLESKQKDGLPLHAHLKAQVHCGTNAVMQKLMIDDISQILLAYQLKELIKVEDNQIVPCNDLAMNILDASVVYDQRNATNRNMDF